MKNENNTQGHGHSSSTLNQSHDQLIALLSVYNDEWCHRDNALWNQTFRHFIATIIIMMMPNISTYFDLQLDLPVYFFRFAGLAIAFFSYYVSMAYAFRLEASGDTYRKLLLFLPDEYQRTQLKTVASSVQTKNRNREKGSEEKYVSITNGSANIPKSARVKLWLKPKMIPSLGYRIPNILFVATIILFLFLILVVDKSSFTNVSIPGC